MKQTLKLLRVRDAREELEKRLGMTVTPDRWKHWQRIGLVLPAREGPAKYEAYITLDEVEIMTVRLLKHFHIASVSCRRDRPVATRRHYRRPGIWRQSEIRDEVMRRVGLSLTCDQFDYCRELALIPEPKIRIPAIAGGLTMQWGWTDQQVEVIIATLSAHIKERDNALSPERSASN
jgi:hypothetical protein